MTEPDSRTPAYDAADELAAWRARSRIVLTPMAAPSIMGMFGFTLALLMVGCWQAGWYGTASTPQSLWPFTLAAGGLLQIIAAAMALRARDSVAVAVHTAAGSFWLGWSVLQLLSATHVLPPAVPGSANPSMGIWFVALAAVILWPALGALSDSVFMSATLVTYVIGLAITAAGWFGGNLTELHVAGWFFVVAGALGWYTAGAILLQEGFTRTVLPVGKWSKAANVPGRRPTTPISFGNGMPGVRVGQ